jgi:flavorubredoxin
VKNMDRSVKITDNVTFVGKIDHELRSFHGEELSTFRGSSYNAYLVKGEKTKLIDTVWTPFAKEFVDNLKSIIDLNEIDYVISLHGEVDHSGALPYLMREIPGTPIYCSVNALSSLKGMYHQDWNFVPVKTGDKLDLGGKSLTFIEARMLHWPDNLMCYLDDEQILFSTDIFGQHISVEELYDDTYDLCEIMYEAKKYYANIITPYAKMARVKLEEVLAMNLPIKLICPSHGVIWRSNINAILENYQKWSSDYKENQICIVYDTMWNSTKMMAEAIAQGIGNMKTGVTVKVLNSSKRDKNDIIAEIFSSKAVLFGSSTVNRGILSSIATIFDLVTGLKFVGKKAAAFGSYGWGGEGVKILTEMATKAGFELVNEGIRAQWVPDEEALGRCIKFGEDFIIEVMK